MTLADGLSLGASFALGAWARQPLGHQEGPAFVLSVVHELPYLPLYLLAMATYGLYRRDGRRVRATSFLDTGPRGHALIIGAVLVMGASAAAHRLAGAPKIGWVEVSFMSLPAIVLLPAARATLAMAARSTAYYKSRLLILGSGVVAASLSRRLGRCDDIELLGFIDDNPHTTGVAYLPEYLGTTLDLPRLCTELRVDRVLVAFSQSSPVWLTQALRSLPPHVRVSVVPRLFELVTWQSQLEEIHGLTVMDVAPACIDRVSLTLKRSLDLAVSALMLFVLAPLMAAVALAIKATSAGPVLFRQERVGYRGRPFKMLKFRTMDLHAAEHQVALRDRNEADGPLFKLHDDPRVTTLGRALRRASVDELPQLFNVFLGQMSLVGPRPFVPGEAAGIDGWAARRFEMRPGMTGLWQVSGRSDLPFEELRRLDYAYVASWSLWWDLKILWHTPGTTFRRRGAY